MAGRPGYSKQPACRGKSQTVADNHEQTRDGIMNGETPERAGGKFPPTVTWEQRQDWPVLDVARSRQVDQIAIERYAMTGTALMEWAGGGCAQRIAQLDQGGRVAWLILAGGGNNGGDGYVIARHALEKGRQVEVHAVGPTARLSGDARWAWQKAAEAGVTIREPDSSEETAGRVAEFDGILFDCLLGTGSKGAPREPMATFIRAANAARKRPSAETTIPTRVAVDLPTGLDADSGEASEPTFQADCTLTFVAPKPGLVTPEANRWVGRLEIVDIGIPDPLKAELGIPRE